MIARDRDIGLRLSPLLLMTDPAVHDDVCALATRAPQGCAIIYRHFGAENRKDVAQRLRQITFARNQQFLIGDDPTLAIHVGADGVHFRRDPAVDAPTLWRRRCPDWLISMAGIKADDDMDGYVDYSGELSVLDGLLISSVFHSDSPSAGRPLGITRLLSIAAVLGAPIYALGGVNDRTAPDLEGCGLAGIAGRTVP